MRFKLKTNYNAYNSEYIDIFYTRKSDFILIFEIAGYDEYYSDRLSTD